MTYTNDAYRDATEERMPDAWVLKGTVSFQLQLHRLSHRKDEIGPNDSNTNTLSYTR